jgi:hypothetical protein
MPDIKTRNTAITLMLAGFVLAAGGAGAAYVLFQNHAPAVQEVAQASEKSPEALANESYAARFEDILNDFLKAVQSNVRDYRQSRKMLAEMVDPFNLRQPEYIEENFRIMGDLSASLRTQMDGVFAVFETTEAQIKQALGTRDTEDKNLVWQRWQAMKKNQLLVYVEYFAYEDRIISAYEDLITFYYQNRNLALIDSEFLSVSFADPALVQQEQALRQAIENLTTAQSGVLKQKI